GQSRSAKLTWIFRKSQEKPEECWRNVGSAWRVYPKTRVSRPGSAGSLQGLEKGAAFVQALLVFGVRVAVPGDAAADVVGGPAVRAGEGADGDGEIGVAVVAEIAEGAGVGVAGDGLQLGDDLHGADLRRAGDAAAGMESAEGVEAVAIRREFAADGGDEVMHGGVAFEVVSRG